MLKVSVIIPCYNLGNYIDEAVDSVLNQTYQNFEIIIVNDGSTDSFTNELLKKYNKPKTKVIHTENMGVSSSRNTAIQNSTGEIILPLDADDKIAPTYLEKGVQLLEKDNSLGIVYCEAEFIGDWKQGKWDLPAYSFPEILFNNVIFCTAFYRKKDWEKVKGYNSNMVIGLEDHDFWISMIEHGVKIQRIPEILFYYRVQQTGRNSQLIKEKLVLAYFQILKNHKAIYSKYIIRLIKHWITRDTLKYIPIFDILNFLFELSKIRFFKYLETSNN